MTKEKNIPLLPPNICRIDTYTLPLSLLLKHTDFHSGHNQAILIKKLLLLLRTAVPCFYSFYNYHCRAVIILARNPAPTTDHLTLNLFQCYKYKEVI